MKIRLITCQDAKEYIRLRNGKNTFKWFYSKKKFDVKTTRKWISSLKPEEDCIFIAEEDKNIVGTVSVYRIKERNYSQGFS